MLNNNQSTKIILDREGKLKKTKKIKKSENLPTDTCMQIKILKFSSWDIHLNDYRQDLQADKFSTSWSINIKKKSESW